ncbi:hypothetical protein [Ralstonia syzygii]|uniref:Uncharacterized protein n=1 Tax=Ralstonia syzygii R24 TaxID=907261 RepID=G3A8C9_9RALS|nr:hypothetical protein [Ralstonia syzygii]CCA87503.1 hypothetical protein RALSY_mp10017 [Ralstonia syzygii R24]
MTQIISPNIDRAVKIAEQGGNSVSEISEGWSKVRQVVQMSGHLTAAVRSDIERQVPSLRYWSSKRTPHNAAGEGYICEEYGVGISFPTD